MKKNSKTLMSLLFILTICFVPINDDVKTKSSKCYYGLDFRLVDSGKS